jgi:hypothetical protein
MSGLRPSQFQLAFKLPILKGYALKINVLKGRSPLILVENPNSAVIIRGVAPKSFNLVGSLLFARSLTQLTLRAFS